MLEAQTLTAGGAVDGAGPLAKRDVHVLPLFVQWYFLRRPLAIVKTWARFSAALQESFSLLFLVRTLFAPWKRIVDPYPKNMFDVSALFGTLVFNIVTRVIGAVIRLAALAIGLALLLLTAALFLAYLLFWIAFPFLATAGLFSLPLFR